MSEMALLMEARGIVISILFGFVMHGVAAHAVCSAVIVLLCLPVAAPAEPADRSFSPTNTFAIVAMLLPDEVGAGGIDILRLQERSFPARPESPIVAILHGIEILFGNEDRSLAPDGRSG